MYTFKKTLNAIQVPVLLAIFMICQNSASAQVTLDFTGVPNGKEELTQIVLIHVKNEANNIRIFPNPIVSGTRLTVEIPGASEAPITIELFNATGQLVQSFTNHTGTQTLDTSDWPTGVYTLRAGRSVAKIVVKH